MKSTGIIRRIDELGRIVIPKEIRRTLRITDGENLEIYVDDEQIILKKYSMIKKIKDFAQDFTDSIYTFIKHNIIITDTDTILALSGPLKKEYIGKCISGDLEDKIKGRLELNEKTKKILALSANKELAGSYAISPIIINGDTIGCIIIFDENNVVDQNDFQVAQIASKFLSTHLEQ